jgi:hypothetical protein
MDRLLFFNVDVLLGTAASPFRSRILLPVRTGAYPCVRIYIHVYIAMTFVCFWYKVGNFCNIYFRETALSTWCGVHASSATSNDR